MNAKAIASYVGGVASFVLVTWLLRGRVGDELAFAAGGLAMLLVGFTFTRYISPKPRPFKEWALFSVLGAIAGMIVFVAMKRFL